MNFILISKIKNCTKDVVKVIGLILLSIMFLICIMIIKFKPVYIVTLSGKTLGYVENKEELNNKIEAYINNKTGTIAVIDIATMPEYTLELVPRNTKTSEDYITRKIESTAVFTYKTFAVTVNGETQAEVATMEEAQEIIDNLKTDLNENIEFDLGITENYSTERKDETKEIAFTKLNEIKVAKTTAYEEEQARLEAERIAAQKAAAARQRQLQAQAATTPVSGSKGNVNGIAICNPLRVSPLITSRFGEKGSRRYTHTGLDLATSTGTPIYPIASGTVTFSGWQGSYGYLVIVNHGNGVE